MAAFNSITQGHSLAAVVTRAIPEPEAELAIRAENGSPEPFNIVEIKDIWSDLEVCRASASWNLSSYLNQMRPWGSDQDAPEPSACTSFVAFQVMPPLSIFYYQPSHLRTTYLVTRATRESLTRSNWRAKIDMDDLRRDLLEMKTILDFLASRNNAFLMGLSWGIASVL